MKALIKLKEKIASGTMLFEIQVPAEFHFEAGQYLQLILPNGLKHYFSIASSPSKLPTIELAMRLTGSEFKNFMRDAPLGQEVEIRGPWGDMGEHFLSYDNKGLNQIFIAGGIGITMLRSIIQNAIEKQFETKVKILYFNRDQKSTPFFEEIKNLPPNFETSFVMSQDREWQGEQGRISEELIRKPVPDISGSVFYAIGPPAFANNAVSILQGMGVLENRIIFETYTGY